MRYSLLAVLLLSLAFGMPAGKLLRPDYGQKLYDLVRGTPGQKEAAMTELRKSCAEWGVSEKKMVAVIMKESQGKIMAYNRRTEARGLCQVTESALKDLPFGHKYYRNYEIASNVYIRRLNKDRVYTATWNIRAGVAYMKMCEDRAPGELAKLPPYMRQMLNEEEMSALLYNLGIGNIREFTSGMRYAKEF